MALVKIKKLVGGGVIKIVNNVIPAALLNSAHTPQQSSDIVSYIDQRGAPSRVRRASRRSICRFSIAL